MQCTMYTHWRGGDTTLIEVFACRIADPSSRLFKAERSWARCLHADLDIAFLLYLDLYKSFATYQECIHALLHARARVL